MDDKNLVPKAFLSISACAFLCCFSRSDYNLPLFLFAYLIWHEHQRVIFTQAQRVRVLFLMVATSVVDIIWILYWGKSWNNSSDDTWMNVVHRVVFILSIIEIIAKIGTIVLVFSTEKDNLIENSPDNIGRVLQKL